MKTFGCFINGKHELNNSNEIISIKNPYDEKILNENTRVRTFNSNVSEDHLIWHRDRQDRVVEVVHSNGWMFQRDDSVPIVMSSGDILEVSANEWHRIIKGKGDLVLKIIEEKKRRWYY